MGFLDTVKNLFRQNDDKVDQAIDKAGEVAKGKVGGHDEQIDNLAAKAKEATGEGDTTTAAAPPAGAPPAGSEPPPPATGT